jgi:2-polyprenyl-3-methyl-5-hydroxy-6-metoxy-1,4-benzoquinol methylase
LPYRSNSFDHVFCYTVLEHVRDVKAALHEMIRVLKPGGVLILNTPEYRFPFESHYKIPLMLKPLPRLLSAAILKLAGKPARPLLREVTYVTSKQVQHLLMEMPSLRFFRVFESYPEDWLRNRGKTGLKNRLTYALFRFWSEHLEIYKNQEYYVFKVATGNGDSRFSDEESAQTLQ